MGFDESAKECYPRQFGLKVLHYTALEMDVMLGK